MAWIVVDLPPSQLLQDLSDERVHACCRTLEQGGIVYFPVTPLKLTDEDLAFLRGQRQSDSAHHKNIAYRPLEDRLTGYGGEQTGRMLQVLREFSHQALNLLHQFLRPYRFEPEFASFRPLQEAGRNVRQNARNDLLHVDSFPTRPTSGKRILRFFTNIHPTANRVWKTGPDFSELARRYASESGLLARYRRHRDGGGLRQRLASLGLPLPVRPAYDEFMHGFHNWLKANQAFQTDPSHPIRELAPNSSWLAMTDTASHAVLSGQYALEQTVLILPETLLLPELTPIRVLDSLT